MSARLGKWVYGIAGMFARSLGPRLGRTAGVVVVLILPVLAFGLDLSADPQAGDRIVITESIKDVPAVAQNGGAHVVRDSLTSAEMGSTMHVVVSLQLRRAIEFHSRLSRGLGVPQDEVEATYLPLKSDYERVVAWLLSEGFVQDGTIDPHRLNIFVHHSVADVARVFQLRFARVATSEGEFTSAVTAPSVPAEYGSVVLGIMGLQPHLHFHRLALTMPFGSPFLAPPDVRTAYNVPANLTGAGQAIGIIMQGPAPLNADVSLFWTDCNVPQSLNNYSTVTIDGGSAPNDGVEGCVDVEWSSAWRRAPPFAFMTFRS